LKRGERSKPTTGVSTNAMAISMKEASHMADVQELGCIVCRKMYGQFRDAEIHHLVDKKRDHFRVLPLCMEHHRGGKDSGDFISRHPYKARFEKAYGSEQSLLDLVKERLEDRIDFDDLPF